MNDGDRFLLLNIGWAALNPSEAYYARKAMNEYRKLHPVCEITGSDKSVQVHHIIPVWSAPDLAADPENFISLSTSANIHLILGHTRSFRLRYVKNIKDVARGIREEIEKSIIINRAPEIETLGVVKWWYRALNYIKSIDRLL